MKPLKVTCPNPLDRPISRAHCENLDAPRPPANRHVRCGALLAALLVAASFELNAAPMNPAFNYQGRLYDNGSAVSASYDFRFTLLQAPNLPVSACPAPLVLEGVSVINGVFTVSLPFCEAAFDGADRWLQVEVSPHGAGRYSLLQAAQPITATPYALHADTADRAATADQATHATTADTAISIPWAAIQNPPLTTDLPTLDTHFNGLFWKLGGNTGIPDGMNFLGTTGSTPLAPLDLVVNNHRVLRLEQPGASPNLIGGDAHNQVTAGVSGGTIGGGGYYLHAAPTILMPSGVTDDRRNSVTDDYGTVAGGKQNRAGNDNITLGDAPFATVGGGQINIAAGRSSTVAGGEANTVAGAYSVIPGGLANVANGNYSFAAGLQAKAFHQGSFVWADSTATDYLSTANDQFSVRAGGGIRLDGNVWLGEVHDLRLRNFGDIYHGIGFRWQLNGDPSGSVVNGPFIYGWSGGALGTSYPADHAALTWTDGGDVSVTRNLSTATLTIRGGADVAEPFNLSDKNISPGSVVVIDEDNPGRLKLSRHAYDRQVAGIISGANGINPGISLHQDGALEGGQNVALTGRVYVQADASSGAIRPGDLLTTSDTPGRAMKVGDPCKAQGAILGKAMSSLASGDGLVLVLVTLQ